MTLEDFKLVLSKIDNHEGLVDLHGFGEPLIDTNLLEKIKLAKIRWPNCRTRIYSTLGIAVPDQYFHILFESGLDILEVSLYGRDASEYARIHGSDTFSLAMNNLKAASAVSPKSIVLRVVPHHPKTDQKLEYQQSANWLTSIGSELGVTVIRERSMHNWGSGRNFNKPGSEVCSVVNGYRSRILQVTWDLNVIPCCFDFDGTVVLGNLKDRSVTEIFESSERRNFINSHVMNSLDDYPVCKACEKCTLP